MFGKRNPRKEGVMDLMIRALGTGSASDAILGQESDGQRSFVGSDTLPTQMSGEDREALEAAGLVFEEVVEGDELFQHVQLPQGWRKSGTEHPMYNDLLDNKGRKRAMIFYKASFYDRRADLHCVRRFSVGIDYDKLDGGIAEATVTDVRAEIFRSRSVSFDVQGDYQLRQNAKNTALEEAYTWLSEQYPDWESFASYWD